MYQLKKSTQMPDPRAHEAGSNPKKGFGRSFLTKPMIVLWMASLLLFVRPGFAFQADPSLTPLPTQGAPASEQELEQLVAPIALYPDELAAQVLAASTYPDQVVEADRWIQQHSDLKGQALAEAVDQQPWDASVKALAPFPSVLANMDKNLSWTSSLGDAYVNQQQDVMNAIQVMRQRAQHAGNLQSTSQEKISNDGNTILIEPADPQIVYVPEYDPWLIYGGPVFAWPGWYREPGIFYDGPEVTFGYGFGIGFFSGFGWGWPHWGFDWHDRAVLFNHDRYVSHSRIFAHRDQFGRARADIGHGDRGIAAGRARDSVPHGFAEGQHGGGNPQLHTGVHSGAFSGFGHGGSVGTFSARGHSSFGGGFHGGGFHASGGHAGGRR